MSGNARDFNNIETRAVIKSFFSARQGAEGNSRHSDRNIRVICTIVCHRQKLCGAIQTWWFFHLDAPRPRRPKTVTTPEIIDEIQELIFEDCWISAKSIAEQLGISHERVGSIIHEYLDMWKFSARWVPKCLNADQKRQQCQSSEQFWNFFGAIEMISFRDWWPWTKSGYITMTRRQSNIQWSSGIAAHPAPKKFRVQKSAGKVLGSIFWDQEGILPIYYLPKSQTINAEYYSSLMVQLKDTLKEKRRGKFTKGGLVLARQCRGSPGTCNPEGTGLPGLPVSWLPHPILQIWARRTVTCSLDWKNN